MNLRFGGNDVVMGKLVSCAGGDLLEGSDGEYILLHPGSSIEIVNVAQGANTTTIVNCPRNPN